MRGLEDGSEQVLELEDGNGKQVWGLEDGQGVSGALFCGAELLAEREGDDNLGSVLPGGALAQKQEQRALCKLLLLCFLWLSIAFEDGDSKQVLDLEDGDGEQVRGLEDGTKEVLVLEDREGKQV